MTDKKNQDEIDLFLVVEKLKAGYNSLLASFFRAIQFVLKHWIVLLILIVGGYLVGYFIQKNATPKREATLLVQNNFDSSSYVYEAIKLLNVKYGQRDEAFLSKHGFDLEKYEFDEITIEPIVNIMDLLEMHQANDRNLDSYMGNIEAEEDLLTSEAFYTEYTYHRITIKASTMSRGIINKVLEYLNSNELLNEIKEVTVKETLLRVERNNTSIANIDAVFENFAGKKEEGLSPSQVYMNTLQNDNLDRLLERKKEIIDENEKLMRELLKYDNVVTLINQPDLYRTSSTLDNKKLIYPVVLVFLYIVFFVMRGLYARGRRYSEKRQA